MDHSPPPLPRLVLPSEESPGSPDPMASFEALRRRKHFHEFHSSLRSSSPSGAAPGDPAAGGDRASVDGSPRFRDRLATRLSRTQRTDEDNPNSPASVIMLQDSCSSNGQEDGEAGRDLYRWATMVENQRGIFIFGLSKYSSSSLLPNDPPPYTIPPEHAHGSQTSITPHNLTDYQLPDASWVWVSKTWLVQMGGNGSSVDGYEYNWCFRRNGWRPTPGRFSVGGWVRRRQWVRLMMRPARSTPSSSESGDDGGDAPSSLGSPLMVWSGDKDVDWLHVRQILKDLQIDGRHIAIWRQWLSPPRSTPGMFDRDKENPPTSSGIPVSADPSDFTLRDRDCAEAVLRAYISHVLSFFVFPESRHVFIDMLRSLRIDVDTISS